MIVFQPSGGVHGQLRPAVTGEIKVKACSLCHVVRALVEFGIRKSSLDGRNGACRDCCNERTRSRIKAETADAREDRLAVKRLYRREHPKRVAFERQRWLAGERGIEWDITEEEFIEWWGESFARRGRGADDFVMARYGDRKGYTLDNIHLISASQNSRDAIAYISSEEESLALVKIRRADENRRRMVMAAREPFAPLTPEFCSIHASLEPNSRTTLRASPS